MATNYLTVENTILKAIGVKDLLCTEGCNSESWICLIVVMLEQTRGQSWGALGCLSGPPYIVFHMYM